MPRRAPLNVSIVTHGQCPRNECASKLIRQKNIIGCLMGIVCLTEAPVQKYVLAVVQWLRVLRKCVRARLHDQRCELAYK